MSSLPILQSLKETILTANVKAVYGEPIAAQGKTIIPVAKIIYGYVVTVFACGSCDSKNPRREEGRIERARLFLRSLTLS